MIGFMVKDFVAMDTYMTNLYFMHQLLSEESTICTASNIVLASVGKI